MHEEQCMKSAVHAKGKSKRTTFTAETAVIAEKPLSLLEKPLSLPGRLSLSSYKKHRPHRPDLPRTSHPAS
jgi:hypothetical protein